MGGLVGTKVVVPDARGRGHLQVTWHRDRRTVVVSQWHDEVCVASTQVAISDVARLVGLLVRAMGEALPTADGTATTEKNARRSRGALMKLAATPAAVARWLEQRAKRSAA